MEDPKKLTILQREVLKSEIHKMVKMKEMREKEIEQSPKPTKEQMKKALVKIIQYQRDQKRE